MNAGMHCTPWPATGPPMRCPTVPCWRGFRRLALSEKGPVISAVHAMIGKSCTPLKKGGTSICRFTTQESQA